MEDVVLYVLSETVPNWLMAASAVSAAVVFAWRRQDRAERLARQTEEVESQVNAVWVAAQVNEEEGKKWGVLVTNALRAPISDLEISCGGNNRTGILAHKQLPPGSHLFVSMPSTAARAWSLPQSNIGAREFITSSTKHEVYALTFRYGKKTFTKTYE
ncbi:hypothetical protein V6245_05550 [Salinibacterium amurskyense]|uniref:hypothetical protein n=1 Tax=Salinibacterium amurskyense TaxID=205941 RepID=UPI00311D6ED5